jgi:hypothetical protein
LQKACDYTLVVAGQDADHEDPESQRQAVGARLVRLAVGKKVVVFHPTDDLSNQPREHLKSEDTARLSQIPVIAFDPNDEAVQEAVRDGQATIVDLGMAAVKPDDEADNGAIACNSNLLGRRSSAFSMRSQGQDTGAMLPPGTEASG